MNRDVNIDRLESLIRTTLNRTRRSISVVLGSLGFALDDAAAMRIMAELLEEESERVKALADLLRLSADENGGEI